MGHTVQLPARLASMSMRQIPHSLDNAETSPICRSCVACSRCRQVKHRISKQDPFGRAAHTRYVPGMRDLIYLADLNPIAIVITNYRGPFPPSILHLHGLLKPSTSFVKQELNSLLKTVLKRWNMQ
jgi:hypothetical protein